MTPTALGRKRRLLLSERAEPAEQMRIAPQFGRMLQFGGAGTEVGEEAMRRHPISAHSAGAARQRQIPDLLLEKLLQGGREISHDSHPCGVVRRCAFQARCDRRAKRPPEPSARTAGWCGFVSGP